MLTHWNNESGSFEPRRLRSWRASQQPYREVTFRLTIQESEQLDSLRGTMTRRVFAEKLVRERLRELKSNHDSTLELSRLGHENWSPAAELF